MKSLFIIIPAIILTSSLSAQDDSLCAGKLRYARELFNSGQIEQIPALIYPCLLMNGFTKNDKLDALRLLINAYLFDYNRDEAQQTTIYFLKHFPYYKIQPDDPVEFVNLIKSFSLHPSWSIGVSAGINRSEVTIRNHFNDENSIAAEYSPQFGLDIGASINRYFSQKFWLSLDLKYTMINYKRTNIWNEGTKLNYSESAGWVSAPLYLNHSLGGEKFRPFIFAGGDFAYLFSAKGKLRNHDVAGEFPDETYNLNMMKSRETFNIWLSGGLGLICNFEGSMLKFSLGYGHSILPFVKNSGSYITSNFADEEIRLNHYICSVGFTKTIFKIKK